MAYLINTLWHPSGVTKSIYWETVEPASATPIQSQERENKTDHAFWVGWIALFFSLAIWVTLVIGICELMYKEVVS